MSQRTGACIGAKAMNVAMAAVVPRSSRGATAKKAAIAKTIAAQRTGAVGGVSQRHETTNWRLDCWTSRPAMLMAPWLPLHRTQSRNRFAPDLSDPASVMFAIVRHRPAEMYARPVRKCEDLCGAHP